MENRMFAGRVALVTGAASGIGEATARAFAEHGAGVVVADIRLEHAERVAAELRGKGAEAIAVRADVSQEPAVAALIETTTRHFGRLDFAFNNAGVIEEGVMPLHLRSTAEFNRVFDVNVRGTFLCLRQELALMTTAGSGVIVNNASVAGSHGVGGIALYSASKHAIVGLTKSVALEAASSGVRVNVLLPDATHSEMLRRAGADKQEAVDIMSQAVPMRRLAQASEQANVVIFLCSDSASFVTGAAIASDGGRGAGFNYLG